jgi:DnaK suppressor protein
MVAKLDVTDPKAVRRALEAELRALTDSSAAAADDRRPVELDQQSVGRLSRMDALQVQAMAKAVEERRQGRTQRLKAALRRLDEDEFGICAQCGEDIPLERIATDITVARCVACSG